MSDERAVLRHVVVGGLTEQEVLPASQVPTSYTHVALPQSFVPLFELFPFYLCVKLGSWSNRYKLLDSKGLLSISALCRPSQHQHSLFATTARGTSINHVLAWRSFLRGQFFLMH